MILIRILPQAPAQCHPEWDFRSYVEGWFPPYCSPFDDSLDGHWGAGVLAYEPNSAISTLLEA